MESISTPIAVQRVGARLPRWASFGILFGILSTAAIALYGPIGVSGTYPRFVGAALRRVTPEYAAANPYLVKMGTLVTPETMLVVGLLIGGFLAALIGVRAVSPGPRPSTRFTQAKQRQRADTATCSSAACSSSSARVSPAVARAVTSFRE